VDGAQDGAMPGVDASPGARMPEVPKTRPCTAALAQNIELPERSPSESASGGSDVKLATRGDKTQLVDRPTAPHTEDASVPLAARKQRCRQRKG
jgi:hypothetical protein